MNQSRNGTDKNLLSASEDEAEDNSERREAADNQDSLLPLQSLGTSSTEGTVADSTQGESSLDAVDSKPLPVATLPSSMRRPSVALQHAINLEFTKCKTARTSGEQPGTPGFPLPQRERMTAIGGSPVIASIRKRLSMHPVQQRHLSVVNQVAQTVRRKRRRAETGVLVTEDLKVDDYIAVEDIKEDSLIPKDLILSLRNLPNPMSVKRDYRQALLSAAKTPVTNVLQLGTHYQNLKDKFHRASKFLEEKFSLWSDAFKLIEGRFGTGVVSFFVFLRWLLILNFVIFIITIFFIVLPSLFKSTGGRMNLTTVPTEDFFASDTVMSLPTWSPQTVNSPTNPSARNPGIESLDKLGLRPKDVESIDYIGTLLDLYAIEGFTDATLYYNRLNRTSKHRYDLSDYCLNRYKVLLRNETEYGFLSVIQAFFQGTGWMEYTRLFMGSYAPVEHVIGRLHYNIAVAFIIVLFMLVILNLVMMMSYCSKGVQESMLEGERNMYSYIIFCGWDLCIVEERSAERQHSSIHQELLSTLAEARRNALVREWTTEFKVKIYGIRSLCHLASILALVGAYYLIFYVTKQQLVAERTRQDGLNVLFFQYLPPLTITVLNFVIPLFVYILVQFEEYNAREQIAVVLIRIVVLRLASIIILVSSFYYQINCEPRDMCGKGYESCPSPICWETYVGQQMYRLALMDLVVHIAVVFFWETPRNYVVKKFKNKATQMLGRQVFDIPTQVLALVYSQTLCWLGMFYCPLLPGITFGKIIIFFYIKKYSVLANCIPEQIPYKASRSNAIFVIVLMVSFFITICVLGYSVTQIDPSLGCGPFRYFNDMVHSVTDAVAVWSPELKTVLFFIFSPLFVVPVIVLLCLALYYYITKASAHKKMVKILKVQLTMEGKDKQFLLKRVTRAKQGEGTKRRR